MVSAESTPLEDPETGKKSKHVLYFKAKVIDSNKAEEVNNHVSESIDENSIVFIDMSTSYVDLTNYVEMYVTEKSNKESTGETLSWGHIFIINAKRNLLGNYHKIKGKYLQLYLNEFVNKLNRRFVGKRLFDRVVVLAITSV